MVGLSNVDDPSDANKLFHDRRLKFKTASSAAFTGTISGIENDGWTWKC
jgi:hypothetical protein